MEIPSVNGEFVAGRPQAAAQEPTDELFSSASFLRLLAAQISNQNPLEPMKDTEFIAQMAQFSQLEQTTNLAQDIRGLTMGQQLAQGTALIGRSVTYEDASGALVSGSVERLWVSADGRQLKLSVDGTGVDIGQIVTVES